VQHGTTSLLRKDARKMLSVPARLNRTLAV